MYFNLNQSLTVLNLWKRSKTLDKYHKLRSRQSLKRVSNTKSLMRRVLKRSIPQGRLVDHYSLKKTS